MSDGQVQWIVPTRGAKTLPVVEILTGRGVIFGKSGSGKSNSAGVIAEELLENNYSLLIVDPEGEYYGLKERYEILHVGNSDICDVQISPENAEQLAEIGLEQNMPIILDVSDYLDADEASALIANTVRALFQKEKEVRKPFLLMIEEMQEYLPQQGGTDELSELLERVAKRGRKRGLGMLGMSQRPSSVDKDFITQCDWMVWHRLTWKNDVNVVRDILGSEYANQIERLETGEAFLMTDWDEDIERVMFREKSTRDVGATPGLDSYANVPAGGEEHGGGDSGAEDDAGADADSKVDEGVEAEAQDGETAVAAAGDSGEAGDSTPEKSDDNATAAETQEGESGNARSGHPPAEASQAPEPQSESDPAIPRVDTDLEFPVTALQVEDLDRETIVGDINRINEQNRRLREQLTELGTKVRESDADVDFELPVPPGEEIDPNPRPPAPPEPPEPRTGVAGSLVEFAQLIVYMIKLLVFRIRYSGGRNQS